MSQSTILISLENYLNGPEALEEFIDQLTLETKFQGVQLYSKSESQNYNSFLEDIYSKISESENTEEGLELIRELSNHVDFGRAMGGSIEYYNDEVDLTEMPDEEMFDHLHREMNKTSIQFFCDWDLLNEAYEAAKLQPDCVDTLNAKGLKVIYDMAQLNADQELIDRVKANEAFDVFRLNNKDQNSAIFYLDNIDTFSYEEYSEILNDAYYDANALDGEEYFDTRVQNYVNQRDENGKTIADYLIYHIHESQNELRELMDSDSDIEKLEQFLISTRLRDALKDTIKVYGLDLTYTDNNNNNVFHTLAQGPINSGLIKLLNDNGAKINGYNRAGVAPVHIAASYGELNTLIELMKHGADINIETKSPHPVILAAEKNHWDIVKDLLGNTSQKIDINVQKGSHSLVGAAIKGGNLEALKMLKGLGADFNLTDEKENTFSLLAAQQIDSNDKAQWSKRYEVLKFIVDNSSNQRELNLFGDSLETFLRDNKHPNIQVLFHELMESENTKQAEEIVRQMEIASIDPSKVQDIADDIALEVSDDKMDSAQKMRIIASRKSEEAVKAMRNDFNSVFKSAIDKIGEIVEDKSVLTTGFSALAVDIFGQPAIDLMNASAATGSTSQAYLIPAALIGYKIIKTTVHAVLNDENTERLSNAWKYLKYKVSGLTKTTKDKDHKEALDMVEKMTNQPTPAATMEEAARLDFINEHLRKDPRIMEVVNANFSADMANEHLKVIYSINEGTETLKEIPTDAEISAFMNTVTAVEEYLESIKVESKELMITEQPSEIKHSSLSHSEDKKQRNRERFKNRDNDLSLGI